MDNELSFRALEASGERNIPCGFDVKALEILFPEEMNAYRRWKTVSTLLLVYTILFLPSICDFFDDSSHLLHY